MKRFARPVVLSLLCLTTFTLSASAECAWVLWLTAVVPSSGDEFWTMVQGYKSVEQCNADADRAQLSMQQAKTEPNRKRAYACLPDTVDPRGPKAK